MAFTIDQVNSEFDQLQAAIVEAHTDVGAYIQGLKAQIAAGTAVSQAQLDALGGRFAAVTQTVREFDINNSADPVPIPPMPPIVP